ncbi:sporulation integral membrane protein YtvI [Pseudalkalibacillus caeni]|uniref:Sporulation integral membrane protein YtvI n=1 Tax=Exobacillus caeni TaxID=2574798 RepID=A0A5R9FA64_9BACL|nr:sporulation integral membrane protein YtvI [Pseudalkalibacillus caeni]TLS39140.1 sporulation integral membrane protein YtvI [Pseudalkalibacillus caeni]
MNLQYVYSAIRFFIVVGAIAVGFFALYYIWHLAYPFLIALLLAFLINPLVDLLQRKGKMHRALSVTLALLLLIGIISTLLTLLINEIVQGVVYLANVLPEHFTELVNYMETFFMAQIMPIYNQLEDIFKNLDAEQRTTVLENVQSIGTSVTATFTDFLQAIAEGLRNFFVSLPTILTVLIFSLLATFFISKDWYRLGNWIKSKVPERVQDSAGNVYRDLQKALFGFVKAQLTLISITAVIVLIGLLILKVKYAITIALIIGLVDLLPYLGTGAVFVPWIAYSFITGNYSLTIGLAILYGVVVIQRQIMEPKVLSSSIGLDPLATLIALFVGFQLFGFLGLIIGPVSLVVIKTLFHANVFRDLWNFIIGIKVE